MSLSIFQEPVTSPYLSTFQEMTFAKSAKRLYTLVVPQVISMYKRKYIYMHSYNGATAGSTVVRLPFILNDNHII